MDEGSLLIIIIYYYYLLKILNLIGWIIIIIINELLLKQIKVPDIIDLGRFESRVWCMNRTPVAKIFNLTCFNHTTRTKAGLVPYHILLIMCVRHFKLSFSRDIKVKLY